MSAHKSCTALYHYQRYLGGRVSLRTLRNQAVHLFPTEVFTNVVIGDRLRALREQKNFSQGEIEKRTGLLRCYVSRVENGHTVPAVETLEKFARALEVPIYQLFYEGEEPPKQLNLPKRKTAADIAWGSSGKDARMLEKFRRLFSRTTENDLKLLLFTALKMARKNVKRREGTDESR